MHMLTRSKLETDSPVQFGHQIQSNNLDTKYSPGNVSCPGDNTQDEGWLSPTRKNSIIFFASMWTIEWARRVNGNQWIHWGWAADIMTDYRFRQIHAALWPELDHSSVGDKCHQLRASIVSLNEQAKRNFILGRRRRDTPEQILQQFCPTIQCFKTRQIQDRFLCSGKCIEREKFHLPPVCVPR